MSTGLLQPARTTPPQLSDATQYTRIERVPVFSTHIRKLVNPQTGEVRITKVDAKQLEVICNNTNDRVRREEFPLLRIGHTDSKLPEVSQPHAIGYFGKHEIGEYNGEPVIMAEMFIENEYLDMIKKFPRRSAEVFNKESPSGYIDSVALLTRAPELDLGYITHHSRLEGIEIFECQCHKEKENMDDDENLSKEGATEGDELSSSEETNEVALDGAEEADSELNGNAEKLAKVLAKHAVDMMKSDKEFHDLLGGSLSQALVANPDFLDALMSRMGELLEASAMNEDNSDSVKETENHEAGTASGTNTFTPEADDMPENFNKDTDPNVQFGLLNARIEVLEEDNKKKDARILELEGFSKNYQKENRDLKRRSRLEKIAESGVILDVDKTLEKFEKLNLSDEGVDLYIEDIQENFSRSPIGQGPIPVARDGIDPAPRAAQPAPFTLTEKEVADNAIEKFGKRINFVATDGSSGTELVKRYFAEADRSPYGVKK